MRNATTIRLAIALTFVLTVFLWHWLGPVHGQFIPSSALTIFWGEFGNPLAWPLTLCLMLAVALKKHPATYWISREKNLVGAVPVTVAFALFFPLPNSLLSTVALLLVVFLVAAYSDMQKSIPLITSAIVGVVLVSYAFTVLKLSVFMLGREFDIPLKQIDALLGFETLRNWLIEEAHGSKGQIVLAEISYQMIFPIVGMFAIASYIQGKEQYETYVTSLFLVYAVGTFLYILIPAWGPFMQREFADLAPNWFSDSWRVAELQKFISFNSLKVRAGDYYFTEIPVYGFVAAMPSLHVATPAVAFLLNIRYGGVALGLSALLLLTSAWAAIVTGMHYGVDLLVGFLLAMVSTKLATLKNRLSS
ncbi:PAP2 superfamily protein [Melaminivora alkalimesophila]|uniref:PAP2 superfamily protein n=1 Tax=Melaminivora alkalimesophila TaxID=1165852 RepID=A0A317RC08_9BURK|nr:phosphatase PAP2 family protein [Melaminivora alkalimesophila]PWW46769.1 PAP2 superfamily protein [Melaminivora alkalimesophila]